MNAAFIIAEYNPFHYGHAYHIATTREKLRPDALVCIMSGHFTQRGSAALVDKWSRARMALHGGADLVLELHPVYACSSAETFARGALMTISLLGVRGWLSFGAEYANLQVLCDLAKIMNDESELFKTLLSEALGNGQSYAAARQIALVECYMQSAARNHDCSVTKNELNVILKGSNNILAIEYLRAIQSLGLPYTPCPLPRAVSVSSGNGIGDMIGSKGSTGDMGGSIGSRTSVNSSEFEETARNKTFEHDACPLYKSASIIREEYRRVYCKNAFINTLKTCGQTVSSNDDLLHDAMPEYSRALIETEFALGRGPIFDESFFPFISALLKREGAAVLRGFIDVNEGLENRIYDAALQATSYDKLIDMSATRRYPKSRIRRILMRFMLGYDEAMLKTIRAGEPPPYIRVLGFNDAGQKMLASCKPEAPLITNFKTLKHSGSRSLDFMRLDARATDIYAMGFQNPYHHTAGQDFLRGPARLLGK